MPGNKAVNKKKSPAFLGPFHSSRDIKSNVVNTDTQHSIRGLTIRITLSPSTDGKTEARKGIRLVARGNHRIHSFPNLSRNILEPSRLSVPTPRLFMVLGEGTPRRLRRLLSHYQPDSTRSPNGAWESGGFKWPHSCVRSTFCNLRYLEGHKTGDRDKRPLVLPPSTSTPPTRESLFS